MLVSSFHHDSSQTIPARSHGHAFIHWQHRDSPTQTHEIDTQMHATHQSTSRGMITTVMLNFPLIILYEKPWRSDTGPGVRKALNITTCSSQIRRA